MQPETDYERFEEQSDNLSCVALDFDAICPLCENYVVSPQCHCYMTIEPFNIIDYKQFVPKSVKLTDADHKFINNHIAEHIVSSPSMVFNPWSGHKIDTTPLISTLVDCVQSLQGKDFSQVILDYYGISEGAKIQAFDRARMIVLKLDSALYMDILD